MSAPLSRRGFFARLFGLAAATAAGAIPPRPATAAPPAGPPTPSPPDTDAASYSSSSSDSFSWGPRSPRWGRPVPPSPSPS